MDDNPACRGNRQTIQCSSSAQLLYDAIPDYSCIAFVHLKEQLQNGDINIFTDLKPNKRRDQMNFSGIILMAGVQSLHSKWGFVRFCCTLYSGVVELSILGNQSCLLWILNQFQNQNTLPRLLTQFMKRCPQYAWSGLISKLGFEIAGPRTPVWHRFSSFV